MKILVTSGGTRVPIDGVRYIGNTSTGKTGTAIASKFRENGHQVTLLRSKDSATPKRDSSIKTIVYTEFKDLKERLKEELQTEYDVIIHLAAVSDFLLDHVTTESGTSIDTGSKINSSNGIVIHLKKAPKLLNELREYSKNKNIVIVGFKLTNEQDKDVANQVALQASKNAIVNLTVHNHLPDIKEHSHPAQFLSQGKLIQKTSTKEEMAEVLVDKTKELIDGSMS